MESNNDQGSSLSLHKRTLIYQHRNSLNQTSTSLITLSELVDPRTYNNKKRLSMSLPAGMNLLPRTCSSVNLQLTQIRSKLIRRNIISAKLSVLVMMLLFLAGVLLSITYNQVQAIQVLMYLDIKIWLVILYISYSRILVFRRGCFSTHSSLTWCWLLSPHAFCFIPLRNKELPSESSLKRNFKASSILNT